MSGVTPQEKAGQERSNLLFCLASCSAAAVRLLALAAVSPPPLPWDGTGTLRAVFLATYPLDHYGTVSRLGRWVPHMEKRGVSVEILTPSPGGIYEGRARGDPAADALYERTALRSRMEQILQAKKAHVVILHRAVLPFSPWQRPTFDRLLARFQPRLIYDFYDTLWAEAGRRNAGSRSALARWLNPPDVVGNICRAARVVTVSGEFLATYARKFSGDVRIVPMLLNPGEYAVRGAREADPPVLGWMGNRGNIRRLLSLAPALAALAKRRRFLLRVVAPERVEMPGVPIESLTHPWSEESEREDLASIDVGLLPLFDGEDDRGKFPFKSLQYAAAGLPMIATPVAVDQAVFRRGIEALYAGSAEEWVESMDRLLGNVALRGRMGAAARKAVEENYSFEAHADAFADLLRTVAADGTLLRSSS